MMNLKKQQFLSNYWYLGIFYILAVASNGNLVLCMAICFLVTVYILKDHTLPQSLFLTLIALLPIEKVFRGRWVEIIATNPLMNIVGYSYNFGIGPKIVIASILAILLLLKKGRLEKPHKSEVFAFILLLYFTISTWFTQKDTTLAISGYIAVGFLILFLVVSINQLKYESSQKVYDETKKILVLISLFLSLIGTLQTIKGGPIGLNIESNSSYFKKGNTTSDGVSYFRSLGLSAHSTYFGSQMTLLLCFILYITHTKKFYIKLLTIAPILISIYGTFSRSAWICAIISILIFLLKTKQRTILVVSVIVFTIVALGSYTINERLATIPYFLSTGSGPGRIDHINIALQVIKDHPVFGVGINRFPLYLLPYGLDTDNYGFIFPIHNTFLLMATEIGLPGAIIFFFSILRLGYTNYTNPTSSTLKLSLSVAILVFFLNSQLHAIFIQDISLQILAIFYSLTLHKHA